MFAVMRENDDICRYRRRTKGSITNHVGNIDETTYSI